MKLKEALKLEKGQKIMHNRYGECTVKEVMMSFGELFGVVVTPTNENSKKLLIIDSGTNIPDFLEDSVRHLQLPE